MIIIKVVLCQYCKPNFSSSVKQSWELVTTTLPNLRYGHVLFQEHKHVYVFWQQQRPLGPNYVYCSWKDMFTWSGGSRDGKVCYLCRGLRPLRLYFSFNVWRRSRFSTAESCNETPMSSIIVMAPPLDCGSWDAEVFVSAVMPSSVFFTGAVDFSRELWWFCHRHCRVLTLAVAYATILLQCLHTDCVLSVALSPFIVSSRYAKCCSIEIPPLL